jgi:DNA-binding HxlR family transcriptional regulator
MIKNELKDTLYPTCPIRNILSRVGDKWSMLVLITLNGHDVMRFNELRRNIPDISQKMLSEVLKALEADDLVSRKVYAEVPPRVEYRLTERALTLIPLIEGLIDWALSNMDDIMESRKQYLLK